MTAVEGNCCGEPPALSRGRFGFTSACVDRSPHMPAVLCFLQYISSCVFFASQYKFWCWIGLSRPTSSGDLETVKHESTSWPWAFFYIHCHAALTRESNTSGGEHIASDQPCVSKAGS